MEADLSPFLSFSLMDTNPDDGEQILGWLTFIDVSFWHFLAGRPNL